MTDTSEARATAIAEALGHPFAFRRKTDPQLAAAVERGHLGLLRGGSTRTTPVTAEHLAIGLGGSIEDGHTRAMSRMTRDQRRAAAVGQRTHRRWPLLRAIQADQGDYPACVGATEENWEKSLPIGNRSGLGLLAMYQKAKQIDGYPTEDGTTSDAMVQVCQQLGLVEQAYRFTGTESDKDAVVRWLLDVSSLWWGSNWPESAFRTRLNPTTGAESGLIEATGSFAYGHEVLILAYEPFPRVGPCFGVVNWPQWGVQGRGWIPEADFWRWMAEGQGDLLGVLERRQ